MTPLVELRQITKTFGGKRANSDVNLTLYPGETLALLGENGAGKSTLMNILSGIYRPDSGEILLDGKAVKFKSPQDAIDQGIGMVHQHFMLVPSLSAWENILLGTHLPLMLPKKEAAKHVAQLSETYHLDVNPNAPVGSLSVGEQQRVAILKALYQNAKTLILDEPTAVLTPQEAKALFVTIKRMNEEGRGVLFISHKLDEVLEVSHRVAILRQGHLVQTLDARDSTKEALASAMVGSAVQFSTRRASTGPGKTILALDNATARDEEGQVLLKSVTLQVREGEILGLAGVSGNGQVPLCEALAGLLPLERGAVLVEGKDYTHKSPRAFLDAGIRYIPADRRGVGTIGNMNAVENSALRRYKQKNSGFGMDWKGLLGHTKRIITQFNVATPSVNAPVRNLSGGNLQKLMMGRELSDEHKVLLAMNPTWGLDISAAKFVRDRLLDERDRGLGVLLVSEDLDELLQLSDRIIVMFHGELTGEIADPTAEDVERIGLMMAGERGV